MVGLDLERLHPGDVFFSAKFVQARERLHCLRLRACVTYICERTR